MSERTGNSLAVPTVFAALLALLGVVNAPSRRPSPSSTGEAGPKPAEARSPGGEGASSTRVESLLRPITPTDSSRLQVLEPLIRFHSPRLASMRREVKWTDKALVEDLVKGTGVDDLEFLILTIPHPTRSGTAFRYDNTMLALQQAMRRADYVLDSYRIPWSPPSASWDRPLQVSGSVGLAERLGLKADWSIGVPGPDATRQPGLLLFRRYKAPGVGEQASPSLRAVLLVANTPVLGVETAMLTQAMDIALARWQAKGRPKDGDRPAAIRIVGPDFSGSPSSITRTLDAWVAALDKAEIDAMPRPAVLWLSGSAQAIAGKPLLTAAARPPVGPAPLELENFVAIKMMIHGSATYSDNLLRFIGRQTSGRTRVAFLSEETSGFGLMSSTVVDKQSGDYERHHFTFPLHISEMRRRYEKAKAEAETRSDLRTAERLRLPAEEDVTSPDLIRLESPGVTAVNDEMRLLQVANEIRRLRIGHVILSATDMRDSSFLAEFLRSHCPDARVYTVGAELAYTQQGQMSHFRGLISASTYPNSLIVPDGTGDGAGQSRTVLPNQGAYGIYNAILAHMIEMTSDPKSRKELADALIGYGRRYEAGSKTPPLWICVASQQGYFPVTVGPGTAEPSGHLWESPVAFTEDADASLFDPAQTKGWIVAYIAVSLILLSIALTYSISYVRHFVLNLRPTRPSRVEPAEPGEEVEDAGADTSSLHRRASFTLDHLGLVGLWRTPDQSSPADRRRRKLHLWFFLLAPIAYSAIAAPAWGGAWSLGAPTSWLGPPLFWATWLGLSFALVAALDVALSGRERLMRWVALPARADGSARLPLLFAASRGVDAFVAASRAAEARRPGRGGGEEGRRGSRIDPEWIYLLVPTIGAVALATVGGLALHASRRHYLVVSPPVGGAAPGLEPFLVKLFCARAGALASGVSPLLPALVALAAGMYLTANRLRDVWVVRPFRGKWRLGPIPGGLSMGLDFFAMSLDRLHRAAQAGLFTLRHRRPRMVGLALGAIAIVWGWMIYVGLRHGVVGLEPPAVAALLLVGLLGLFAALAWMMVLSSGLWAAIEEVAAAAMVLPIARIFGELPRHVARRFGSFYEAIQGEDAGAVEPSRRGRTGTRTIVLEAFYQQQANALQSALLRASETLDRRNATGASPPIGATTEAATSAEAATTEPARPPVSEVAPRLAPRLMVALGRALARPATERSGAVIGKACCKLLLPFWTVRTAARASDPPTADARAKADARADETELAAFEADDRPDVRRLLDSAETFVAMELAREINRSLAAFWLRLTAVTVLSLLLLIYVNSYPFRPSGQCMTLAVLTVAVASVVVVRAIWGFQTNPFIAAIRGRRSDSAFSPETFGRLSTYALPLILGLVAMLSFAASDILRVLFGPLL